MAGAFFIVYHLVKFGLDLKTRIITAIFLAGLAVILSSNFYLFFKIDWPKFFNDYFIFPKII